MDGVVVGVAVVGRCVGENVSVGGWVGPREGVTLGALVVGRCVGVWDGSCVGRVLGVKVGCCVG